MSVFKLPDVGEGLTEAEIVTWRVSVGDVVKINDVLVDIETAKSIVELPSPYEGEVTELLVSEGDTVNVGTPIISIGTDQPEDTFAKVETAGRIVGGGEPEASSQTPEPSAAPERQAMLVGYGPRTDVATRRRRKVDAAPRSVASVDTEKVPQRSLRALAKPPVRKLAKELGIDLAEVPAEGETITRADVEAYVGRKTSEPAAATQVAEPPVEQHTDEAGDVRIPIKGVRKWTADAMVRSAFTAPHVTEWVTLDVSKTMELVAQLKKDKSFADLKVSPTVVVAKAICLAMRRTPELNSTWDDDAQEIVLKKSVNLGIAAATERGLVVPNIVGADSMSMVELAAALADLTDTARAGRTQPAQMSGGTFSLTNIGVFGVDAGTPILNPGEAGILAVGTIARRPWVDDEVQVVPRWVTTLALSFDHRVV